MVKALRYKSMGPGIDPGGFTEDFFLGASTVPCALESTQPLKMSTRKLLEGEGGRCVKVTTLPPSQCRMSRRSGSLNLRNPTKPLRLVTGNLYLLVVVVVVVVVEV